MKTASRTFLSLSCPPVCPQTAQTADTGNKIIFQIPQIIAQLTPFRLHYTADRKTVNQQYR